MQLSEMDRALETVEEFLAAAPTNPVALAQKAILAAARKQGGDPVGLLQQSLANISQQMPMTVYEAVGVVAHWLMMQGRLLAARAHFTLQISATGQQDTQPLEMLMKIESLPQASLLLKQNWPLANALEDKSADPPWTKEYDAIRGWAMRGAWANALETLTSLVERYPDEADFLQNIAVLQSRIDAPEAAAAWRTWSRSPKTTHDDAVEAEAMAQLFDEESEKEHVTRVRVTYGVKDAEALSERLMSDEAVSRVPIDPATLVEEGSPPPKGAYWVLDRPLIENGADLCQENVSKVMGELRLFGKETDRAARLELLAIRDGYYGALENSVKAVLGDLNSGQISEQIIGHLPAVAAALSWNWRLPDNTPPEVRERLVGDCHREMMFSHWTELPQGELGGRTAIEAAKDPASKIPLLAAILLLELSDDGAHGRLDYNELRVKLGLPPCEPIDPKEVDMRSLPSVRLTRVVFDKLSDDELKTVYRRATMLRLTEAIVPAAKELVARGGVEDVDMTEAYQLLAGLSTDKEQTLEYFSKARESAAQSGESPAAALLAELQYWLGQQNPEEAQRLIQTIQSRHINEQGVGETLFQLLVQAGVLTPDGQPAGMPPPAPTAGETITAGEPAAEGGKLWTPGNEPAATEKKSSIWVPGMD